MACSIETTPLGFVVLDENDDGEVVAMPKTLPGQLIVFRQRRRAEQLADAIDADDMPRCHEIIQAHGLVAHVA